MCRSGWLTGGWGFVVVSLAVLAGCNTAGSGGGGGGTPGQGEQEPGAINPAGVDLCGVRTVSEIPDPGFVREAQTRVATVTPDDSGLARVVGVFAGIACDDESSDEDAELDYADYEVAAGGEIVDSEERFVVIDRCLEKRSDLEDEGDDGTDDEPFEFPDAGFADGTTPFPVDDLVAPAGDVCGDNGIPLGPSGLGDTSMGYICVTQELEVCRDCRRQQDTWNQSVTVAITYRALGSISGVAAFDLCGGGIEYVDVQEGDTVTIEIRTQDLYEWSAGGF